MNPVKKALNGKKISVVFNEYASPFVEDYMYSAGYDNLDTIGLEELDQVLRLPWMIWNAVVLQEDSSIDYFGSITLLTKDAPDEVKELIRFMKKRKETKFKKYNFCLGDIKLNRNANDSKISLTVAALLSSKK